MDPFKYIQSKWVYGYHRPVEAIRKLNLKKGSSLLILGSGFGKTAMIVAKHFKCSVIGAEFFPFFVDKANKRAHEEGLASRVKFMPIERDKPYLDIEVDAVFFESILSFLEDPSDTLSYYSGRLRPNTKMGVIEITFHNSADASGVDAHLKEIFGVEADFRKEVSWLDLFQESKLNCIQREEKPLGLMRKFWEDLQEEPWDTIVDLSKTLYLSYTDVEAKKSMKLFRRFFKEYSDKMMSSYYLLNTRS